MPNKEGYSKQIQFSSAVSRLSTRKEGFPSRSKVEAHTGQGPDTRLSEGLQQTCSRQQVQDKTNTRQILTPMPF
jgi:hypothetical protein